ncbi:hypothetical protein M407DRAFT_231481 [Tulasnella calospora MUT 4182]|uniref:F-box domain-containing protein n=1 Tax=Tulasnella calospora MUT 4182 TaxID=1051891 RepID=A0A0C3M2S1_9AGAM|nr:hypothetical protein M407DRAFT_231481 [Tulasnella calospora MUT 4182]
MELLIVVLLMALSDAKWFPGGMRRLASVCKYWRDVIVSTSQFWRIIDTRHGRRAWSRVLRKNPEGLLDIRIGGYDLGGRSWEFNHLIKPELKRIRSISLAGPPYFRDPQYFLNMGSLPLLSDVTILMSIDMYNTPPVFEAGDGVPFQHVHLAGVVIPWDSPRLGGLESLTIWGIDHRKGLSFSGLHHVLSSSPRLRRLSLFKWTFESFSQAQTLPTIKLPSLMSLVISGISEPMNNRLLSMIEAPGLMNICWLSVRGSSSGAALLDLSKRCIRRSTELVLHWTAWSKRLVIRSEPWLDRPGLSEPSPSQVNKTVHIGIDGIEEPSHFMGSIAPLLNPSSKVLFKTDSEELISSVADTLRSSGAAVDIRLSKIIRYNI